MRLLSIFLAFVVAALLAAPESVVAQQCVREQELIKKAEQRLQKVRKNLESASRRLQLFQSRYDKLEERLATRTARIQAKYDRLTEDAALWDQRCQDEGAGSKACKKHQTSLRRAAKAEQNLGRIGAQGDKTRGKRAAQIERQQAKVFEFEAQIPVLEQELADREAEYQACLG